MIPYINDYLPQPVARALDIASPSIASGVVTGIGSLAIKNISFPGAVLAGTLCHGVDTALSKYIFSDYSRGIVRPLAFSLSMGLLYSTSLLSASQILTVGLIYIAQSIALNMISDIANYVNA